jgi:hypothetical protein
MSKKPSAGTCGQCLGEQRARTGQQEMRQGRGPTGQKKGEDMILQGLKQVGRSEF